MSQLVRLARIILLLTLVVAPAATQESAQDYLNRGIGQKERGEFDAAIASFRSAIDLQPDLAAAHTALGEALLLKSQVLQDAAITSFQKAIDIQPDSAPAQYALGEALLQNGQVDDAIASFRKAIEVQPNFAPAHFGLGMCHETKGDLDEAIVSFREAINLDPNIAMAYVHLGMSLVAKRQFGEGIEFIRKGIDLLPNDAEGVLLKTQLRTAVESLGRARISSNEADVIGDIRFVIAAEQNYASTNGGFFDNLKCLGAPSSCVPTLPTDAPALLGADIVSVSVKSGYKRTFYPGPAADIEPSKTSSVSPSSISSYAYVAVPVEPGVTGRRGFCGEARGLICYTEDGSMPDPREGVCPPTCIDLGGPDIASQDSARFQRAQAVVEKTKLAATTLPEWRRAVEALEIELSVVIGMPGDLDIDSAKAELEQLAGRAGLDVGSTEVETLDYELYQEAVLRLEPATSHSAEQIMDFVARLEESPRFFRPRRVNGGNQVETSILASKRTTSREFSLDFCPTPTDTSLTEMEWEEMLCMEMAQLEPIVATINEYRTKVAILEQLKARQ